MTSTPPPVVIKQNMYTTVYLGAGDATSQIPSPKLGYFYINATDGTAQVYDGTDWNDVSAGIVISI